ncbi:hypothetical protein F5Y16DRAFT_391216 [Xylariaceae sp. FL0255]|nr:hypothetical protein F5Y16DRAFT_391216 [Xylariaceae sp. FL0255]
MGGKKSQKSGIFGQHVDQIVSVMVSHTFLLDIAKKSLEEDGFFELFAPDVGTQIVGMEERRFPFLTPYGLTFLKTQVLDDTRLRNILEASFDKCTLGHWLRYRALPGHIESYFQSGPDTGMHGLAVQLWAKGSSVTYYRGSHLLSFPTEESERRLYETSKEAMDEAGCVGKEKNFPSGGLYATAPYYKRVY